MSRQPEVAIIGGSGFYALNPDAESESHPVETPYSSAPVSLFRETFGGRQIWFLPRHGKEHAIPPHRINYRANIYALKQVGVDTVLSVNAVGGIHSDTQPGTLVIPDQIIDYTWGRDHTYFDGPDALENHVDFSYPYDPLLSRQLFEISEQLKLPVKWGGVYGCTQGPRLESAAEVSRLRRDGCDIVGMTAMPEAALVRELAMNYLGVAMVVNWAAGLSEAEVSMDNIREELARGVVRVRELLGAYLTRLNRE